MTENLIETNKVKIIGKVLGEKELSHEMYGEKFYKIKLEVSRLSNESDILPATVSERLLVDTL